MSLLTLLLVVPAIGAILVALAGRVNPNNARATALGVMILDFALSIPLYFMTRTGAVEVRHSWIPSFGVNYSLMVDGLSAVLIILTTFLGVLAVLISWREIQERVGAFHVWLLLLQTGILIVFAARDLMLFYFGWELMLIPMLFLIGVWGHEDKLYSALKFFLFTFTGSIFMLLALLYVYFQHAAQTGNYTFEIPELMATELSRKEQWWVFLGLFIGFAVKVPLFPFHTWLPDAHTQAPTAGSLILAGVLLKTGVYGIMRIAMPLAPLGAIEFTPLIIGLSVFGIFYGAITAYPQKDFKRLVAYSSISHLGFVMLGLFMTNRAGTQGAVLQMVNHGTATGGLFCLAGMIQERAHTRSFDHFGGLWKRVPVMGAFLLFFAFASLGMPGTGSFIGELYVIGGTFIHSWQLGAITCFGVLFAAIYSLKVFQATMHGPESTTIHDLPDTRPRENFILGSLVVALVLVGFYPRLVTGPLFYPPNDIVPRVVESPAVAPGTTNPSHGGQHTSQHTSMMNKPAQTFVVAEAAR
jgi:NADH-quinone oxidoreductase subunit M